MFPNEKVYMMLPQPEGLLIWKIETKVLQAVTDLCTMAVGKGAGFDKSITFLR